MLRKNLKFLKVFLTLVLLVSTSVSFVFADNENASESDISLISETNSEKNAVVTDDNQEQKDDSFKKSDLYLCEDEVNIDYIVDGNVFIMANKVTINSQIGGDAFILAKDVVIDSEGYIFNNLFTCAQNITIKGVVYDLYACAQDVNISGGFVYRDLKTVCQKLNVAGTIGRNAFVNASTIVFNEGTENADAETNTTKKGIIYGTLEYSSSEEVNIPDGSVLGDVKFNKITSNAENMSVGTIIANYILDLGAFLAFVLIIWLVCLWLAPKFLESTNNYVGKVTWKVLGYGLLALIAIPIVAIILILLQLTSSVALLLIALYILSLVIAKAFFTITANKFLCTKLNIHKNTGIFGMLIVTGIIVWVLKELPYIGSVVSFVITILGLGIFVTALLPKKKTSNKKEIKKSESTNKTENK